MHLYIMILLQAYVLVRLLIKCFHKYVHGNYEYIMLHSTCTDLLPTNHMVFLLAIKCFTLALVMLRTLIEVYQLYSQKVVGYLRSWGNWIEMSQCISISIFLIDISYHDCFCSSSRAWETGIVSLALTWLVLLVWLQTMHWIGIYVTIMLKIIHSFVKVAVFGVLLMVAFGLSFYMLFYKPPSDNVISKISHDMKWGVGGDTEII